MAHLLKALLFNINATDSATFVGIPLTFVLVALLASLPVAWRASRLDPNVILRSG
jgi:ABC-type lipoprotein release transport system permease subunit